MTPLQYLRILARHWMVLGLPVALALIMSAGYLAITPPSYRATTQLFVTAPTPQNDSLELVGGLLFVRSRMPTYQSLVTSPLVLEAAVREGRLPFTPDELATRISVDQPVPSTLLNITVADGDRRRAATGANAVAAATIHAVTDMDAFQDGGTPVAMQQTRPAQLPARPSWPQPWAVLAYGALLGLLAGLLAAAARHTRDAAIRGREGVVRATGLEPIAVIPGAIRSEPGAAVDAARAEAVGVLRTALQHGELAMPGKMLSVVSARSGDGRTSVAVDLAYALALTGADVVLVETDLRRPTIARLLRLGYVPGLANVLLGQFEPDAVLVPVRTRNLSVMTAGFSAQDTTGLLSSAAMDDLLDRLRREHDHVIVDTPEVVSIEAIELAAAADAVLVVVQDNRTPGQSVAALMRALHRVRAHVVGVVLTTAAATTVRTNEPGLVRHSARTVTNTGTDR